jgi:hypothetical protein
MLLWVPNVYELFPGLFSDKRIPEQRIQIYQMLSLYCGECGNGKYKVATITSVIQWCMHLSFFRSHLRKLVFSGYIILLDFGCLAFRSSLHDIIGFRRLLLCDLRHWPSRLLNKPSGFLQALNKIVPCEQSVVLIANVHDYRRWVGTILRVEEIISVVKEYTSRLSTGYPFFLGKRRVSLVEMERNSTPTVVSNPLLFNRTPKGYGENSFLFRIPTTSYRSIRLNFYTTFNKAKQIKPVQPQSTVIDWHRHVRSIPIPGIKPVRSRSTVTWRYAAPEATIDLPMTPRGIDIECARKELGLQAIAVNFLLSLSGPHFLLMSFSVYYGCWTFSNGIQSGRWELAFPVGGVHFVKGTYPTY